jgi:hypothetical protein
LVSSKEQGQEPLPVYTLGGKSCLPYGIPCVRSFVRCFREPARLYWLGDGTLDDADIKLISAAIPGCRVIRHAEATERVAAFYAQRPACLRLRNNCVNNRQIMDPLALSERPFLYLDTDIHFQRPFVGLSRLLESTDGPALVHSTDIQNAYKIRMRSLYGPGRLKLLARVNSGFFALSELLPSL